MIFCVIVFLLFLIKILVEYAAAIVAVAAQREVAVSLAVEVGLHTVAGGLCHVVGSFRRVIFFLNALMFLIGNATQLPVKTLCDISSSTA